MTYPDFPISPLPGPVSVHTVESKFLFFSYMIITSALLHSPSLSISSSPVLFFDLQLPIEKLFLHGHPLYSSVFILFYISILSV